MASGKSARHRSKLKAKHNKKRMRECGFMGKRKNGGRLKAKKAPRGAIAG
jgi:hypothetical protein